MAAKTAELCMSQLIGKVHRQMSNRFRLLISRNRTPVVAVTLRCNIPRWRPIWPPKD